MNTGSCVTVDGFIAAAVDIEDVISVVNVFRSVEYSVLVRVEGVVRDSDWHLSPVYELVHL